MKVVPLSCLHLLRIRIAKGSFKSIMLFEQKEGIRERSLSIPENGGYDGAGIYVQRSFLNLPTGIPGFRL